MVEGYQGSQESMDRMFERDKNELRQLGIDIDVGDLDPLFEDEPGYKINQTDYAFQLKDLNQIELSLLAAASRIWNDSFLGPEGQGILRKIESTSFGIGELEIPLLVNYEEPNQNFEAIEKAMRANQKIRFRYSNQDREIEPQKIFIWRGAWYLAGKISETYNYKIFKISRIDGAITFLKEKFVIDKDLRVENLLPQEKNYLVRLKIPVNSSQVLRNQGRLIESQGDFDIFELEFFSAESALGQILKYGGDCLIVEPKELNERLNQSLKDLVNG